MLENSGKYFGKYIGSTASQKYFKRNNFLFFLLFFTLRLHKKLSTIWLFYKILTVFTNCIEQLCGNKYMNLDLFDLF